MQDPDKDASETVIEGEATARPGRKKASDKKNSRKEFNNAQKQSRAGFQKSAENEAESSHIDKKNKRNLHPTKTLFSFRNLIGLLMFTLATIVGVYWVSNNLITPSQDSPKILPTVGEVSQNVLQTQVKLSRLQDQVDNLETYIGGFDETIETESRDLRFDALVEQLNELEARLNYISNEITQTQIEVRKSFESVELGSNQVEQFLDSLWVDSQTGKSLTIYAELIDELKSHSVTDKQDEVLVSIKRALNGNLASHARLVNDFTLQLSAIGHHSISDKKILKAIGESEIETNRTADTSKLSDFSWTQYFAGLFNLRKLSEDNASGSNSVSAQQIVRGEATRKPSLNNAFQSTKGAKEAPETLSESIVYLKEILDNDNSYLNSEQLTKLSARLTKLKSREQVDKMIDEIYQSNRLFPDRVEQ